jgi:hypothetical protein
MAVGSQKSSIHRSNTNAAILHAFEQCTVLLCVVDFVPWAPTALNPMPHGDGPSFIH